jgi:hypothetical protein
MVTSAGHGRTVWYWPAKCMSAACGEFGGFTIRISRRCLSFRSGHLHTQRHEPSKLSGVQERGGATARGPDHSVGKPSCGSSLRAEPNTLLSQGERGPSARGPSPKRGGALEDAVRLAVVREERVPLRDPGSARVGAAAVPALPGT